MYDKQKLQYEIMQLNIFDAIQRGEFALVERFLRDGGNPNPVNADGQTALHDAVAQGKQEIAALLLMYGADYRHKNKEGKEPLSLEFTTLDMLHAIRQQYQRLPEPRYDQLQKPSALEASVLAELNQNGIARVSGLIAADELAQLQRDFATFIQDLDTKLAIGTGSFKHYDTEDYFRSEDDIYVTNNAYRYSLLLVTLSCHQTVLAIAHHYLKKQPFIQRASGMRYLSGGRMGVIQFKWHHDMEDKRFKMMILLTDVGLDDQYMTYVLGSHVIFHPCKRFYKNNLELEYCMKHIGSAEIFTATGKAGDIIFFDSNGMHSGNRSKGSIRDTFLIEYTADKYNVWGATWPDGAFDSLALDTFNPFERMLAVKPKWEIPQRLRRKSPSWIESLPHPESWV